MLKRVIRGTFWLLAVLVLATLLTERYFVHSDPPAADPLMPDLPAYEQVEGQSIVSYMATLTQGAALLAGQPQLAAAAGLVDQMTGCFQDAGAVQTRVYSLRAEPLQAGAIAIADLEELTDPLTLAQCTVPDLLSLESHEGLVFQPCHFSYPYQDEDVSLVIAFAGTAERVCADFCSELAGCQREALAP